MSARPLRAEIADSRSFGLWLALLPLLFSIIYCAFAVLIFRSPGLMFFEHIYLVTFVMFSMWLLLLGVGEKAARWVMPFSLAALLSLQYLFYLFAFLGQSLWGDFTTYLIVRRFASDLGHLTEAVNMSRWSVSLVLMGPPFILFCLFYVFRKRVWEGNRGGYVASLTWLENSRLSVRVGLVVLWIFALTTFVKPDVDLARVGHFYYDPIVRFMVPQDILYPMTPRRVYWAEKDALERVASKRQKAKVRNVFLIIVDALRADRLEEGYGRRLTPFMDELVKRYNGRRVPAAFSNAFETKGGVHSILTSKEVPDISHMNYTLPDFMAGQGAHTWLFLSGDNHWYSTKSSYGRCIEVFKDGTTDPGPNGIGDDEMLIREAAAMPNDDGSSHFVYFHLMSAHCTGYFQERFLKYVPVKNEADFLFNSTKAWSREDIKRLNNSYDDRVLQVDDILRRLFETLQKKGYLDDFVGVITADHGEYLGEGGHFNHANFRGIPEIVGVHIPMIFLASRPIPDRVEKYSGFQIDIAPTLVQMAGLQPPATWNGCSLLLKRQPRWLVQMFSRRGDDTADTLLYDSGKSVWKYDYFVFSNRGAGNVPKILWNGFSKTPGSAPFDVGTFDRKASEAFSEKLPPWKISD
jgi:glucan phosphoethanolaminetransferase (alkaline phosphatase superfamily)